MMKQTNFWNTYKYLPLGFYIEPYESYAAMIGVLIDRKQNQISMYNELFWPNKDPNDKYIIHAQIRNILLPNFQTLPTTQQP